MNPAWETIMMYRCLLIITLVVATPAFSDEEGLIGFFASSVAAEREAEAAFVGTPSPEKARAWLFKLTEEPHVAGTAAAKDVAEYVEAQFKSFGLETEMNTYDVFLNHPAAVSIRIVEPIEEELPMYEAHYDVDKDSTTLGLFPGFNGYGASGEARGQVVYVNYGTPDDYRQLEKLGVSVKGKIALARYGKVFRGLKVKEAQDHGALGALLYSDPMDDGYMKGDVYPDGPMRPESAIQRGSVQYLSIQPGDPSTPGWPSRKGAKRVKRKDMVTVPQIPSLPMSYASAEKILRRLGGPRVPDEWQGGLPFSYHVGPGGAAVEMSVEMKEGLMPIYNVIAKIPGTEAPDELVLLGNHRDAWNHGGVDPNSGSAAMLEAARGLAAALEAGWQPRRTVLLASWDAEEYGLVGSTEWGEDMAEEMQANLVAYVNLDSAVTGGKFEVGGIPTLRDLVREIAGDLPEPSKGGTLAATWEKELRGAWNKSTPVRLDGPDATFSLRLNPLGSGSDYTVFVDHLGVPSINFGFKGPYGVYHSAYDNFRWVEKFGDPGFHYHALAAKFYGLVAMRLASADVVPLRFGTYAESLSEHLDTLRRDTRRKARPSGGDAAEEGAPLDPDFSGFVRALDALDAAGDAADRAVGRAIASEDREAAERLNALMIQVERAFLTEEGLPPERPWFKHVLYGPGTTTGYASWPFPGPTQALEEKDAELFSHESEKVFAAVAEGVARLEEIAGVR